MVLFLVLTLTALCTACLYAIYAICLSHFASPYRHLPRPKQPHLFRRFLHEPTTFELTKWVRTVPNDGLIRYFGLLNQERLLLTTIEGYKELLLRDARKYDKLPALAALQWPIGVSGLVSAKGILHKVSLMTGTTLPDKLELILPICTRRFTVAAPSQHTTPHGRAHCTPRYGNRRRKPSYSLRRMQ